MPGCEVGASRRGGRRQLPVALVLLALLLAAGGFSAGRVWTSRANVLVALLAVGVALLFLLAEIYVRSRLVRVILGMLWLLFLPQTAYLFTDLGHFGYQWHAVVPAGEHLQLVLQYVLLEGFAVAAFIFAMLPVEPMLDRLRPFKQAKIVWLVLFNFLVGYGVVLGRCGHINSWVLVRRPPEVLRALGDILSSPADLGLVLL